MSVYTDLLQQLQRLDQEIKVAKADYKKEGFAKIRALMAEYEITAEELSKKVGDKRKIVQAKYKDPETGATWSGRGRTPKWIAGKDFYQYIIK